MENNNSCCYCYCYCWNRLNRSISDANPWDYDDNPQKNWAEWIYDDTSSFLRFNLVSWQRTVIISFLLSPHSHFWFQFVSWCAAPNPTPSCLLPRSANLLYKFPFSFYLMMITANSHEICLSVIVPLARRCRKAGPEMLFKRFKHLAHSPETRQNVFLHICNGKSTQSRAAMPSRFLSPCISVYLFTETKTNKF